MIPLPSLVQQLPPEHYTLESAVAAALHSSSLVRIAKSAAKAEGRRADETAAASKPSVSARASALRFDQATRLSFNPTTPPVTALEEHTETLALTASQRLDLYGQIRSATTQIRLQALADDFAVQTQIRQRTLQAQVAYVELLKALEQVHVAADAFTAAQAQREQAKKLYEERLLFASTARHADYVSRDPAAQETKAPRLERPRERGASTGLRPERPRRPSQRAALVDAPL